MKPHYKPLATVLAATLQLAAFAAVPLAWDVRPGQPAPASFDRYHGEALEFRCTFRGFGELPFAPGADIRLWYQTNGMGYAWWSAPATIQSNVLSATWSPALDPGADRVSLFFGAPSNAYASAVLRLRHSPGFAPGTMPDPETFHERDPVFSEWLSTYTPPDTSLEPATNYTGSALGAFAATGAVARASSYGTPTRWTDATGRVWEVFRAWNFQDFLLYTPSGDMQWTATECLIDGRDWSAYVGYWLRYDVQGTNWIAHTDLYDTVDVSSSGHPGDDVVEIDGWGTFRAVYVTNLVGRVALTNDIPAVPAWAKAASKPTYTASEVGATDGEAVTNIVRQMSLGGIYDEELGVWWTPHMSGGAYYWTATTNVNLAVEGNE